MIEPNESGQAVLDRALAGIGRQDGIDLKLNDDGVGLMEIEGGIPVVLELTGEHDDSAVCHVALGPMPDDYHLRYQIFQAALQCNLQLPSRGMAVVALDPNGGVLVLTAAIVLDGLDTDGLRRCVSDACALANELRDVIGVSLDPEADPEATVEANLKKADTVRDGPASGTR